MADVRFTGVGKAYGGHRVLSGLDLTLGDGECFTLLGPSGCGKTVLLRLAAGFERLDAGEIAIGGSLVSAPGKGVFIPPEERGIGVVFQDYAVWPHLSVLDNVAYPLKIRGLNKAEAASRAMAGIAQVGLEGLSERLPSQLSGGQQQRVALARALVASPSLLLLDEPLSNLDANLREEMRFEIKELKEKTGVTILYVTHDQEVALALSDRLAVMDEAGVIRQTGAPREVFDHPAGEFVFRFMGVANLLPVRLADGQARLAGPGLATGLAIPAGDFGGAARLGFRPGDAELTRENVPLSGTITRRNLLGADIDWRLDLGGVEVRVRQDTREALEKGLYFEEGERAGLIVHQPLWFPDEPAGGAR